MRVRVGLARGTACRLAGRPPLTEGAGGRAVVAAVAAAEAAVVAASDLREQPLALAAHRLVRLPWHDGGVALPSRERAHLLVRVEHRLHVRALHGVEAATELAEQRIAVAGGRLALAKVAMQQAL